MDKLSIEEYDKAMEILKKSSERRSEDEISFLVNFTKEIKFFQEMSDTSLHRRCCECMYLETFKASEYVFRQGERGFHYYVILSGVLNVLILTDNKTLTVASLREGQGFGELALINNKPRMASIQCATRATLAVLDKNTFNTLLGKLESEKLSKMVKFLKTVPLFARWTKNAIERLSFYFKKRSFFKGTQVFQEGTPAAEVFIVKSGEFLMTKHSNSKNPLKISILSRGEVFGDENDMREFTCKCSSIRGKLLVISLEDFNSEVKDLESISFLQTKNQVKQEIRFDTIGRIRRTKQLLTLNLSPPKRETKLLSTRGQAQRTKLRPIYFTPTKIKHKHDALKLINNIRTGLQVRPKPNSRIYQIRSYDFNSSL